MFEGILSAIINELHEPLVIANNQGDILMSNRSFGKCVLKNNRSIRNVEDLLQNVNVNSYIRSTIENTRVEIQFNWKKKTPELKNEASIFNISDPDFERVLFIFKRQIHEDEDLALLNKIIGQEAEKERFCRDLHDGLGQELNVIHMFTHSLKKLDSTSLEFQQLSDELLELSKKSIETLEDVINDESPKSLINSGLFKELQQLMLRFKKVEGIEVEFQVLSRSLSFDSTDEYVQLNIFRIVQEFFTNSLKHSKASIFYLKIETVKGKLFFQLKDNGIGFDPMRKHKGRGLIHIKDRIKLISADFHLETNHKGTQLQFSLYAK